MRAEIVELDEVEESISNWLAEARRVRAAVRRKLKRIGLDVTHAACHELEIALRAIRKKSE